MTSVFQRDYAVIPPCIVKGDGVFLYDDTGRQYLDAMGSAGVVGIGHGRTEVTRALADAGQSVSFVYGGAFSHPWQEELAASLLSIAPAGMGSVYFVSGGSEANEAAMKLARQ